MIFWPCSHTVYLLDWGFLPGWFTLRKTALLDNVLVCNGLWALAWGRGIPEAFFLCPISSHCLSLILPTLYKSWSVVVAFSLTGVMWGCSVSGKMEAAATAISPQPVLLLLAVTSCLDLVLLLVCYLCLCGLGRDPSKNNWILSQLTGSGGRNWKDCCNSP